MTDHPTNAPAGVVEVTQADRDAAVDTAHALGLSAEEFTSGAADILVQALARHREQDGWRTAVIDALVVSHIYRAEHDNDPRKAINDLLCWESKIALDPAVSKDAASLEAQIRADERERIQAWLQSAYETSEGLPINARHMLSVVRRCLRDGDDRPSAIRALAPDASTDGRG